MKDFNYFMKVGNYKLNKSIKKIESYQFNLALNNSIN